MAALNRVPFILSWIIPPQFFPKSWYFSRAPLPISIKLNRSGKTKSISGFGGSIKLDTLHMHQKKCTKCGCQWFLFNDLADSITINYVVLCYKSTCGAYEKRSNSEILNRSGLKLKNIIRLRRGILNEQIPSMLSVECLIGTYASEYPWCRCNSTDRQSGSISFYV